ncbi:DUF2971 domain-containing protein [Micrococcus luteus]|nr:DUF2971 domain-containing protein [Micrococcus luteus]
MEFSRVGLTDMPRTLVHYTNAPAFMSILEGHALWASSIGYMNDSQEYHYLYVQARHFLEIGYGALRHYGDAHPEDLETFINGVGWPYANSPSVYVIALSTDDDDLNLWRAYTAPGEGYCISFDSQKIRELAEKSGWRLAQVEYGASCIPVLEDLWVRAFTKVEEGESSQEVLTWVNSRLAEIAPFYKHESFASEREWRLVKVQANFDQEDLRFRPGVSFIVPFVVFDFGAPDQHSIVQVRCGPGPNQKLAFDSMDWMVDKIGWNPSRGVSNAPFRPW